MVCASSEEKKELHWLREDLASRGSGKKSSTLSPQQKLQKEINPLEPTLSLLYLQCVKIQH